MNEFKVFCQKDDANESIKVKKLTFDSIKYFLIPEDMQDILNHPLVNGKANLCKGFLS